MRALRYYGARDVRVEDISEPKCTPGTVKIKPRFNGLCGSDLMAYFNPNPAHLGFKHPLTNEQPPLVFGHEFSGTILDVAPDITSLRPGDKVAVNPVLNDETCDACLQGFPNSCRMLGFLGLHGGGGGLSDAVVVKESMAFKLPADMDLELGALVESLAVGWHGVAATHFNVPAGSAVALVLGGGPVGCAVVLALKAKGVIFIIVSEPSETRAAIIRSMGVSAVHNPLETSIDDRVFDFTQQRGADVVYECSGSPSAFDTACKVVRTRGQVVNLSLWASERLFAASGALMRREASLLPVAAYTREDFQEVIEALAAGRVEAGAMVTGRIALGRVVEEGLEVLRSPRGEHCKILVDLEL